MERPLPGAGRSPDTRRLPAGPPRSHRTRVSGAIVEPERDGPVGPVFLDAGGRRRRAVRGLAVVTSCAVLGAIALLAAALLGAPVSPSALFPDGDLSGTTTGTTTPGAGPTGAPNGSAGSAATASGAPVHVATTPTGARTANSTRAAHPSTTTAAPAATMTTTTTKKIPPGRPTVLPTPPGHTR